MISGTYEYLMSSLPNLSFVNTKEYRKRVIGLLEKYEGPDASDMSIIKIVDREAEKFLPASDFQVFKSMHLNNIHEKSFQTSGIKILSSFSKSMYELKKQLKVLRTADKDKIKSISLGHIESLISAANPLEKEVQLMRYQWNILEDLSADHFSDMEAVFSYKLKMLLLLRWWSFDEKAGFSRFIKMTSNN